MRAHLAYLKYVLWHKWYVFIECCKMGMPLMGLFHDWTKFLPSEWFPYVHYFHNPDGSKKVRVRDKTGYYKPTDTGDPDFDLGWFYHQKRNKHHWQYWCQPEDESGIRIMPMPGCYVREMLADWRGAGKAQGKPDTLGWYTKNRHKLRLHLSARQWIEAVLGFMK